MKRKPVAESVIKNADTVQVFTVHTKITNNKLFNMNAADNAMLDNSCN